MGSLTSVLKIPVTVMIVLTYFRFTDFLTFALHDGYPTLCLQPSFLSNLELKFIARVSRTSSTKAYFIKRKLFVNCVNF